MPPSRSKTPTTTTPQGKRLPRIILLTDAVVDPLDDVTYQVPKPVHPDVLRRLIASALADD